MTKKDIKRDERSAFDPRFAESSSEQIDVQKLDGYEQDERFTLEFVTPQYAIDVNQNKDHGDKTIDAHGAVMVERETRVLQLLVKEFFSDTGKESL